MAVQQEPEPHHLAIESNGLVAAFPLLEHISLVAESRRLVDASRESLQGARLEPLQFDAGAGAGAQQPVGRLAQTDATARCIFGQGCIESREERGDIGLDAGAQLAIDKGAVFLARLAMRFRATAIAGMTAIGVLRRRGLVVRGLIGRGRGPLMLWLRRGRLMLRSGVSPCRAVTAV